MVEQTSAAPVRAIELFAGSGGFHLGLEEHDDIEVIWANQWEPSTKVQHAATVYQQHFPDTRFVNEDIAGIDPHTIPDHELLMGGWPCTSLSRANKNGQLGLAGRGSNLWFTLDNIIQVKQPRYILLENVAVLLSAPGASNPNRGRDLAIILAQLLDNGYVVEWRTNNGADYGAPQRRDRIWIFAARNDTKIAARIRQESQNTDYLHKRGLFAHAFPCRVKAGDWGALKSSHIDAAHTDFSKDFHMVWGTAGVMCDGIAQTRSVESTYEGPFQTLRQCLTSSYPVEHELSHEQIHGKRGWKYMKGDKKEYKAKQAANPDLDVKEEAMQALLSDMTGQDIGPFDWCWGPDGAYLILQGRAQIYPESRELLKEPGDNRYPLTSLVMEAVTYPWSEGAVQFPDPLDRFSRTLTKSSSGKSTAPSRERIALEDPVTGRIRTLTNEEIERLTGFPEGWTLEASEAWRPQLMGNALIPSIVDQWATAFKTWLNEPVPVQEEKPATAPPARPMELPPSPATRQGQSKLSLF